MSDPRRVLLASAAGSLVEWYDFYISADDGPAVAPTGPKLLPSDVAPDPHVHHLFTRDLDALGQPASKTPLWYHIIKEAELQGGDRMLGALGSRLVAEVVAGGIFYNMGSVYFNPEYATTAGAGGTVDVPAPTAADHGLTIAVPVPDAWTSAITGTTSVTLRDLINYVNA
ncbi:hypothetical protein tb265_47140 [Gemmatimonadetes bacterium T265]|nr:hypothetical protein tb265_47140 [Gemmatimonadetes bacterium T265]